VVGDVHTASFPHKLHLVGLFDVLEHLPDDEQVLRDLNRFLLPGGFLLLTVPAHMSLWSYFDVAACHCRRYQLQELRQKLLDTGYEIEYLSEFMTALFPLVWAARRFRATGPSVAANRQQVAAELRIIPIFNGLMTWLLSLEARWIARRRRLPFGTSLLAVARKRTGPVAAGQQDAAAKAVSSRESRYV